MIEKVSCINLSSPYGDGNIFGNPSGSKSISVIEVVSNDGIKGYGEAYPGVYAPQIVKAYVDSISGDLIGLPIGDFDQFDRKTNKHCVSMSGIVKSIIGAIETAIIDIQAKRKDLPLCKLLVDTPLSYVKCYYSGGSIVLSPDQIVTDVQSALDMGHDSYKMRVGYQDYDIDIDRIRIAREVLQSKPLMVDAIQSTLHSWSLFNANAYLTEMGKSKLFWAEEFVDPSQPQDVSSVRNASLCNNVDLAFGESFTTMNEFDSLCQRKCLDVAQPDVTQFGGIRATYYLCSFLLTYVKKIAFHVWGGPVAIAANLHMASAIAGNNSTDIWMEIPSVVFDITKDLLDIKVEYGMVKVPDKPGLGIEISEEIKEKYAFTDDAVFEDIRK